MRVFVSKEGCTDEEIEAFVEKVFPGCLVHWLRSSQRTLVIARGEASKQAAFLRDYYRLPNVSESGRKKSCTSFLRCYLELKRWVAWWRWPHIEALLCHLELQGT